MNKDLKKGKFKISSGDIFEVLLKGANKGYFQFLYKDDNYMDGHVIRAFDYLAKKEEEIEIEQLVNYPFKFIAHTRVFEGLKDGLWQKKGFMAIELNFEPPTFRQTNDTYALVKKSDNWFIWKHNPENRTYIGELTDKYKDLPFSSILPTSAIVEWLETGWHGFKRPE